MQNHKNRFLIFICTILFSSGCASTKSSRDPSTVSIRETTNTCRLYVVGQSGAWLAAFLDRDGEDVIPQAWQSFAEIPMERLSGFVEKGYHPVSLTEEQLQQKLREKAFDLGDKILRVTALIADVNMRRLQRRIHREGAARRSHHMTRSRRITRRIGRMNVEFTLMMNLYVVLSKDPFAARAQEIFESDETVDLDEAHQVVTENSLIEGIAEQFETCRDRVGS